MNILITGASGLLGRAVFRRLSAEPGLQVSGTAFSRSDQSLLQLDLTDSEQLRAVLHKVQPRIVVHCAAERWPDRCAQQPDAAWQLNVNTSDELARLCTEAGTQLVYISTDYVFDGSAPPYSVQDTPNPVNFYGRSKLAGEQAVLAAGDHWILRLPLLFGPVRELRESGVTALLQTLAGSQPATLDHWATRYPTDVEQVAEVLAQCLEKIAQGEKFSGIYHWSGDDACTRYQLALMVAEIAGLPSAQLTPDPAPAFAEPRPRDCRLDKSRLLELGISAAEPLRAQLARHLAPQLSHSMQ